MKKAEADARQEFERARNEAAMLVSRTRGQVDALLDEIEALRRKQDRVASQEETAKLRAGLRELENLQTRLPSGGRIRMSFPVRCGRVMRC